MKERPQSFSICKSVFNLLDCIDFKSVSVFESAKTVVTATVRGKRTRRDCRTFLTLTIGKPNFRGAQFVKAKLKAGESFPMTKIVMRKKC